MKTVIPPDVILYSIQLYDAGLEPKMLAPPTTDPATGAEAAIADEGVADGAAAPVVVAGVVAVVPLVAGVAGLVLEHPAIVTQITTSIMTMKLPGKIFKTTPPVTGKCLTAQLSGYG
jgi:hypothetical protein